MNFYLKAAEVLDRLDARQGSILGLVGLLPEKDRKRVAALIIETLKYKAVLTEVVEKSKIMVEERRHLKTLNLTLLLVHDILLSNGIQASDGPVKQAIHRHKTRLHGELQKIKVKRGVRSDQELSQGMDVRSGRIPRYVRVNTVIWSMEDAIQYFISQEFRLSQPFDDSGKGFAKDDHILDLLLFHPEVQLINEPPYQMGKIILQDKASCFPPVVLAPPATEDSVVIDATAAPGNKTSQLSALMHNKGKLFAFERDRKRFNTLKMMLSRAHCRNVEAMHADFLNISPIDPKFSGVTHILLDPSCSGSGIVNRLDSLLETEVSDATFQEERLRKLAAFQLLMIRHAMKFPTVQKIVYSTCSIHATENEHVILDALKSREAQQGRFRLAPRSEVLPQWHRRGLQSELGSDVPASSLVRCCPNEDEMNGFFVACFLRHEAPLNQNRRRGSCDGEVHNGGSKNKRRKAS